MTSLSNTKLLSDHFVVRAPSNIALVKYMGKLPNSRNLPENGSLSLTLDALSTWMEVRAVRTSQPGVSFEWKNAVPFGAPDTAQVPELSATARARMERFMTELLADWNWSGKIELFTANTFPAASGIASSASSFAAATLACAHIAGQDLSSTELSRFARQGSGSACRSLTGPWVLWRGEGATSVSVQPTLLDNLWHSVALVSTQEKSVSSSEAHTRVKSSPLWNGRVARAEARLERCVCALEQGDWAALARETWREAWEMHSLFHTADSPFTYWAPETLALLRWLEPWVDRGDDSVLVTIDAGPNVHVIGRKESGGDAFRAAWTQYCNQLGLNLLWDQPGKGAVVLPASPQ